MTKSQLKATKKWAVLPTDYIAMDRGYYFDEEAANHFCDFFPRFLRHSQGSFAGQKFELMRWQRFHIGQAAGWKRPNGLRRFREVYWETGKKNGKSAIMAGMAVQGLSEEEGAEVYIGAVNRFQTRNVYRQAEMMVRASPPLRRRMEVVPSAKLIRFPATNSIMEAMSADVESKDGLNMSRGIIDEIHRFKTSKLYDVMKYAGAARKQPMILNITTAGASRFSLWGQLRAKAERIIAGTEEDLHFLPVLYACDKDDDLDDPKSWKKANPGLGEIISEDAFREEYESAKRIPSEYIKFLRLRLGIPEDRQSLWLDMKLWEVLQLYFPWSVFHGQFCYAAIDISSNKDLTALTVTLPIDGKPYTKTQFFMPESSVQEREEKDGVPYSLWVEQGWITETEGNATDTNAIRTFLHGLSESGIGFHKIGIDPWNALSLSNDLRSDGYDVEDVRQGFPTLTGPSKDLERRLLHGSLRHDGNPVQTWCVGNVVPEVDAAGNIKPSKAKSTYRIDGAVTLIMTLGLIQAYPDNGVPSITVINR